jgi:two-component system LytT family response regulator
MLNKSRQYKAIVIDDETLDRKLIKELVHQYSKGIVITNDYPDIVQGEAGIRATNPDIVFLDINMPGGNGFDLLDRFSRQQRDFLLVFITGHEEYGIQAVKAGAFDYLLKPIDIDELIGLSQKIVEHFEGDQQQADVSISVFTNREREILAESDIVCIEANGSYSRIYLTDGSDRLVSKNVTQLMTELNSQKIKRVHRSFALNPMFIKSYRVSGGEFDVELSNGVLAKVSRKYKKEFKAYVG